MTQHYYDALLKSMDRINAPAKPEEQKPIIDKDFLIKQEEVLKTKEGQELAKEMAAFEKSMLQELIYSTPNGQQFLASYKQKISDLHSKNFMAPEEVSAIEAELKRLREENEKLKKGVTK